jgi:hypothetical protein
VKIQIEPFIKELVKIAVIFFMTKGKVENQLYVVEYSQVLSKELVITVEK